MRVRFVAADGTFTEATARSGERLLDVGQRIGLPLEGTCEGQMACATCHVIVAAADFDRLPPAREEEEDMLDLAHAATRTSRLSCQIEMTPELDGLTVNLPSAARNMTGR